MTTLIHATCPITGEPLKPGETVSRTAVNQLATLVSDLPELIHLVEAAMAGLHHGDQQGPAGIPDSRPPLNLGTLGDIDDHLDQNINIWAISLANFILPGLAKRLTPLSVATRSTWASQVRALITHHQDKIRRWPEAPEAIDAITYTIHDLEHLASPVPSSQHFVGICPTCNARVYAQPYTYPVVCKECQTEVDTNAAGDAMRSSLERKSLTLRNAITAAAAITGVRLEPKAVHKWAERGKVTRKATPGGYLYPVHQLVDLTRAQRGA